MNRQTCAVLLLVTGAALAAVPAGSDDIEPSARTHGHVDKVMDERLDRHD